MMDKLQMITVISLILIVLAIYWSDKNE